MGILDASSLLWSWGEQRQTLCNSNALNQSHRVAPVPVDISFPNLNMKTKKWRSIDAGSFCAIALDESSYAWSWGYSTYNTNPFLNNGILGDNSNLIARDSPVMIHGPAHTYQAGLFPMQWKKIALSRTEYHNSFAFYGYAVGINSENFLYQWGYNAAIGVQYGPTSIVGGRKFIEVDACARHVAAIDISSNMWCWGESGWGALGNGNPGIGTTSSPVQVTGGKRWLKVSTGMTPPTGGTRGSFTVAIDESSFAWAWGRNVQGQLGNNTANINQSNPVSVVGGRKFIDVFCTLGGYTVALDASSFAWAWGYNTISDSQQGYLGDGTIQNRSSPVSVIGGIQWESMKQGPTFIMGIPSNKSEIWGWGRVVGYQFEPNILFPPPNYGVGSSPIQVLRSSFITKTYEENTATNIFGI
jgi:alpha-tubulin suppressor-like RCC1 family protein